LAICGGPTSPSILSEIVQNIPETKIPKSGLGSGSLPQSADDCPSVFSAGLAEIHESQYRLKLNPAG